MSDDRRLIEDFLPIEAISKEASREKSVRKGHIGAPPLIAIRDNEKSVRKGHISTLHLWWARRPCQAEKTVPNVSKWAERMESTA